MRTDSYSMGKKPVLLLTLSVICLVFFAGCTEQVEQKNEQKTVDENEYQRVTDMRGIEVKVPKNIQRVVTISDGFVAGVMTNLGVQNTIVGLGSSCVQRNFKYNYEAVSGQDYTYENGMNPVTYLNQWLMDIPLVAQSGMAMNYETLASLEPDVVIFRVGSCTARTWDDENTKKTISTLESLGIPIIVLKGPPCYEKPDVSKISEEVRIIGHLFGKEDQAVELAMYIESITELIKERTKDVSESEKPTVLMFGLSPKARDAGGAGTAHGLDTIESYFIEDIANARNAHRGTGGFKMLSTEQVLALNPEVIVLPTAWGYHPPSELYTAPYYQNIQELDAVKNRRIWALPWTPCNCAKRIEYPMEVMIIAKAAYPERFDDIKIHTWVLEFYQRVYNVDEDSAKKIRSVQWLEWAVEDDV